jgi:hypothetical protein
VGDPEVAREELFTLLNRAQDERAKIEVAVKRAAEQQPTNGVDSTTVSDQVGRMFLGGFGRKKKKDPQ